MRNVEERNQKILCLLEKWYQEAGNAQIIVNEGQYKTRYGYYVEKLFSTPYRGFREVLLVVLIAMHLDENYSASTGFYDCSPRAIYEGPIKDFFIFHNIPHGQSGPLNVAKAAKGIDDTWAAQRRPKDVAEKVVHLVQYLEASESFSKNDKIHDVAISLMRKFMGEATRMKTFNIEVRPESDPDFLYNLCEELIKNVPDSGNTPQKICAYLLKNFHTSIGSQIIISGIDDRASVTSTTSKKPGDINEEFSNGAIYRVYEITVKPFGIDRIRDSFSCINSYNELSNAKINEISVICRDEDCPQEMQKASFGNYLGNFIYGNIRYSFFNIFAWIAEKLQHMYPSAREAFYYDLNAYISDTNTAESVKHFWYQLHNNMQNS